MNLNVIGTLQTLPKGQLFDKVAFREAVRSLNPNCTENTINWMLYFLRKKGMLASAGAGKYYVVPSEVTRKREYRYPNSEEYKEIEEAIADAFPYMKFQMWELIQLNDFVNHQIAKNVIFIEVESMLEDTVFEMLHIRYPYAMIQPDKNYFFKQRSPGTDIVVQRLLTEAPSPTNGHASPMEKILVDLFSNKLTGNLIEKSEYPRIVEDVFRKYRIDETRMFRYARRRNLYNALVSFIQTQTNVELITI